MFGLHNSAHEYVTTNTDKYFCTQARHSGLTMGSIINPLLILRDENDSFNLFYSLCSLRYSPEIEIDTDQTQLSFLSTNLSTFFPVSFRDPVSQPPLSGKKV